MSGLVPLLRVGLDALDQLVQGHVLNICKDGDPTASLDCWGGFLPNS